MPMPGNIAERIRGSPRRLARNPTARRWVLAAGSAGPDAGNRRKRPALLAAIMGLRLGRSA